MRYLGYQVADSVGVSLGVSGTLVVGVSGTLVVGASGTLVVGGSGSLVVGVLVAVLVVGSLVTVLLVVVWLGAWLPISSGSLSPLELDWSEESSLLDEGRLEALLLVATLELNAPK